MPRFSIIIPAYNAANTIGDTLSAIVAQTYTDWEALVIDDGSVDATREIVGQWTRNDTRIRLAGTQDVIAIAKMEDGSFARASKTVKVTIGGCGG